MTKEETNQLLNEYIDHLIQTSDAEHPAWNMEMIRSGKPNKWNYIDGCMITSLVSLYRMTGEQKYFDFADAFLGDFVNEDGSIKTYSVEEYNLDNINPARNLIALYEITGKEKYKKAADLVRTQIDGQKRTEEGNFWHKEIYPHQVWLDGLYMAQPFYMEYETKYNKLKGCPDSFGQFKNVEKHMKDAKTGLYYHGYDESREMYWADPETGCSPNFWLRATGWFAASLVDTAESMHESMYYEYRYLQSMLLNLGDALLPWQAENGMFYQVIDHPEAEGNYLETSGSALIAYAFLKGARLGFLPKRFAAVGEKIFYGITEKYLTRKADGTPGLGGICLVAGLGGKTHRDGSLEYYFSEPVVEDDAKGIAPLIMAYVELLRRA